MDCRTSPVTGSSRFKKSMRRVTGEKHPQAGCRTVTRGKDWANRFLCLVILPGAGSSAAATEPLTGRFLVFLSRLTTGRHVRPTALLDIGCGWGEWLPTALRAAARKGRLQGKVLYQGLDIARRPIRHLQRDFRKKEADFSYNVTFRFAAGRSGTGGSPGWSIVCGSDLHWRPWTHALIRCLPYLGLTPWWSCAMLLAMFAANAFTLIDRECSRVTSRSFSTCPSRILWSCS